MVVRYPYSITIKEDGKLFVQFPDFPTGFTEVSVWPDVAKAAREVVEGLVEAYKEEGIALPAASEVGVSDYIAVTV